MNPHRQLFRTGFGATRGLFAAILALALAWGGCVSSEEDDSPLKPLTKEDLARATAKVKTAIEAFKKAMEAVGEEKPDEEPNEKVREMLEESEKLHEEIVDEFPGANLGDTLVRLGLTRKRLGDLEGAHDAFTKILEDYPGSEHYPLVIAQEMEIAVLFLEGKQRYFAGVPLGGSDLGAEILEKVLEAAPFSRRAPEALYRLGNYYLAEEEFDEAVVFFETLVRRFADDPDYRIKAEFQAARAHFLRFQGLSYDLTPLEESLARFSAFIEIHSGNTSKVAKTLVGEREGGTDGKSSRPATGAHAWVSQIRSLMAEKNYDIGQWYRRRSHPQAARRYYQYIREEFPETSWAEEAGKRLEKYGKEVPK
ncbi:MAG: tetratricopeptide repeat protein [Planctomycetota bacterium]|jgi:outer membrane protein assembly factor BamD (BamD/ComL family)